jgi:hypothetical protein
MKPELRPVVLGLVIAGFAFAVVLAIVRVQKEFIEKTLGQSVEIVQ